MEDDWNDDDEISLTPRGVAAARAALILFEQGWSHVDIALALGMEAEGAEDAHMLVGIMVAIANEVGALD